MSDKKQIYPQSQLPVRKSSELLPQTFQTSANNKFMSAVIDPLIQPGVLEKTVGYIGRRYGKTYTGSDVYLDTDQTLRSRYQLEPGVIFKKNNQVSNFYDYLDFKNQLVFFGNTDERDDKITDQEHYSWNPPIDWDKFINYREYYWLPLGPPSIPVAGQFVGVVSTYSVMLGTGSSFVFTPDGLTDNPSLTLYRGQTYKFKINAPGEGFIIRTNYDTASLTFDPNFPYIQGQLVAFDGKLWRATKDLLADPNSTVSEESGNWEEVAPVSDATALDYNKGVVNNGIENGTLEFTVPYDAPDVLFYQGLVSPDRVGRFLIADIESNTKIDIDREILGKETYTSSNGVEFTNGLVVEFTGSVTPSKYASDTWLVEGVGRRITLTRFIDLVVPELPGQQVPEVLFDNEGFDTEPFDDATRYPASKDYITIARDSRDLNPWSRYNRWFHKSVLTYAYETRGQSFPETEGARAKRPIIEFESNLQLFQHGSVAKQTVDYIDDYTDDIFSIIEGSSSYNVDGEFLFEGARILFINDSDPLANNRIYRVQFITHRNKNQITLVQEPDAEPILGECVLASRGNNNGGSMLYFDGSRWNKSQEKLKVNQQPKFDVFDENGVSFADAEVYPVSSFLGTNILTYKQGNSVIDPELGFSLSYLNIDNVGDIEFEWSWDLDNFQYTIDRLQITKEISTGFYKNTKNNSYLNGLITTDNTFIQPIIDSIVLQENTNTVTLTTIDWDSAESINLKFYLNGVTIDSEYTRIENSFIFDRQFNANDVISLKVVTDVPPDQGYYELPVGLEKNPLNNKLTSFTLGQATDHLASALEFDERLQGNVQGSNNLRDFTGYQVHAKRFMQHSGSVPLALSLLCDKEFNIVKSLQYAKKAYTEFKNKFIERSAEIDFDDTIANFFDNVMESLGNAKSTNSPFASSDMVGTGAYTPIIYVVEDDGIDTFALSASFSLAEPSRRAVYAYINGRQLLHGQDYTFNDTFGFINITADRQVGDIIEIREYVSTSFAYIPQTPTSLGLYKKYKPMKFIDDTYRIPREVIQGHDGSITLAYGDFRDDLLLELEYRIYNNIKQEYDANILNIDQVFGGYYGNALYSKSQLDAVVAQEFLKWIQNTNINYTINEYFVENESFTYSYSNMTDPTGQQNLPGWWRGVYQWFYDTDRPHRCPWEMLGFSEQPDWWEQEYGPAPYTKDNLVLWEDIKNGEIKHGIRAGRDSRYARPSILHHIPTDSDGTLLSPLDSGLAGNFTSINNRGSFVLGDVSPAEYAWRSSSEWPFAVMIAMSLMKPFDFIVDNFDRTRTIVNIAGQKVDKNTGRPIVIAECNIPGVDSDVQCVGLVQYISDYVKSVGGSESNFKARLQEIDVKLSSRISGFVDKSQQKYLLDSKNPSAASSSIFIPAENYDVIFNSSAPITSLTYSGVIVEKTLEGWVINGYDNITPAFSYYQAVSNQQDPTLSIGGISENFVDWEPNRTFSNGTIVRINNTFYRSNQTHTSSETFESRFWKQLAKIPLVGGVTAQFRKNFNRTAVKTLSYGSLLTSIQQVVDFLLGYEDYLKAQGFVFDGYDAENQVSQDWLTSVKEFMFWTKHNWADGSLITLSPASQKVRVNFPVGVVANLLDGFYDYQVLKADGKPLLPEFIDVSRNFQQAEISTFNTTDGIFYLKLYYVLKEHVVVFDDRTVFNDVIYDKTSGYRQARLKTQGFRTTDWDGDYTSPGFLFDNVSIEAWQPFKDYRLGDIVSYRSYNWTSQQNQVGVEEFDESTWSKVDSKLEKQLVANFDYRINQIDEFYDAASDGIGEVQRNLARHAIGYRPRKYLQDLAEDSVTQFQLYQGFIREKGTSSSIVKVFDKLSRSVESSVELNEEWAFNIGKLGGVDQTHEVEFELSKSRFKSNPQPVLITNESTTLDAVDRYYRIPRTSFTIVDDFTGNNINPVSFENKPVKTAGYVKSDQVNFIISSRDELLAVDISTVAHGDHIWVTFDNQSWTVLRHVIISDLRIIDVVENNSVVTVTFNNAHSFDEGDIIGITGVDNLSGFFKVTGVDTTDGGTHDIVSISISDDALAPELMSSSDTAVSKLENARFKNYDDFAENSVDILSAGNRVWIDQNNQLAWEVIEKVDGQAELLVIAAEQPTVDTLKVKDIQLYDNVRNIKLATVDFVDHAKLKVLNLAEQELTFKTLYDPAVYNIGEDTSQHLVDARTTWAEKHVGELWWNLSLAKWYYAEQSDISYRISNWNRLVPGAEIAVYEWVESRLLPSDWAILADTTEGLALGISGQPLYADDSVYSQKEMFSPFTGQPVETKYYFWVKNKTTIPANLPTRRLSANDVKRFIENPTSANIPFVALIDQDKLLAYNIDSTMLSDTALLNILYRTTTTEPNPVHKEYLLLTEDVADSVPNQKLEEKWLDSLIGTNLLGQRVPDSALPEKQKYGLNFRPRQSMFIDRIGALKIAIDRVNSVLQKEPFADNINFDRLSNKDDIPAESLNLYDIAVDTEIDLEFVGTSRVRPAELRVTLLDGEIGSIEIINSGFGYRRTPPIIIDGDGEGAEAIAAIDRDGRLTSVSVTRRGRKYSIANVKIRPFSVLIRADKNVGNFWSIQSWDSDRRQFFRTQTQSFDNTRYWQLVDWWDEGYSSETRIVSELPTIVEVPTITVEPGELIRIKEFSQGGWAVFERNSIADSTFSANYRMVGREQGTVELSSALYDRSISGVGYDFVKTFDSDLYDESVSIELRNILLAVKEDIFIGEYRIEWNRLFFSSVRYAFVEQRYIDWAFKTSFLDAKHNVGPLSQRRNYRNDSLDSFREYINEVKPYKSTIREYISRYSTPELYNTSAIDFDLPAYFSNEAGKIVPVTELNEIIDSYPWKWWKDNRGFEITEILITNRGQDYSAPPRVVISGNGEGAEATAFISNGQVSGIILTNGGKGYTTTPTVSLVGGNLPGSPEATATAVLGNSVVRTFNTTLKFDRISKTGYYSNFEQTDQFVATGTSAAFDLTYPPAIDKTKILVTKNNLQVLSNAYSITVTPIYKNDLTQLVGRLVLTEIPAPGDQIKIVYTKNIDIFDSVNRIDEFYDPRSGMKGKSINQLMTGIDFGGVQVQGTTFDVTGGWDAVPWFSDTWDSVESSDDYFYAVVGDEWKEEKKYSEGALVRFNNLWYRATVSTEGNQPSLSSLYWEIFDYVELPNRPTAGQQITVYLKSAVSTRELNRPIRIDDPYYNIYDGSTVQPNGQVEATTGTVMATFVGDGDSRKVNLPLEFVSNLSNEDVLIFRSTESDGTVVITDTNLLDTNLAGGNMDSDTTGEVLSRNTLDGAYSTASGVTAEDIVVDGDKFISPDQVGAPEENVPGQVLDSVSIKVFTSTTTAPATINRVLSIVSNPQTTFSIGASVISASAVSVYVDKQLRNLGSLELDYSIDFLNNLIEFVTPIETGSIVEILTTGIGGSGILDYREFKGTGRTKNYSTNARFKDAGSALAIVDGLETTATITNQNDNAVITFVTAPPKNSKIVVIVFDNTGNNNDENIIRINKQEFNADGSTRQYQIDNFDIVDSVSTTASVVVEVNNKALRGPDTVYRIYDGIDRLFVLGVDPQESPGTVIPPSVTVYVNDRKLEFIKDYSYNGITQEIIINENRLVKGDQILITNDLRTEFSIVNNNLVISDSVNLVENDKITITWLSRYELMKIVSDEFTGGNVVYRLAVPIQNASYVTVYKNGDRLLSEKDYRISTPRNVLYLSQKTNNTDLIKVIIYGQDSYVPPSAFEIHQDMLNNTYFTRYSSDGIKLAEDLNYYDRQVIVTDASQLTDPIKNRNIPGVIYIGSERIEYLEKQNNVLSQLRRGSLGTPIAELHLAESQIIDVSYSERLPYIEKQEKLKFDSDGTSVLIGPLGFIPEKSTINDEYVETIPEEYGICNELEVFVGGRRLRKNSTVLYNEDLGSSSPAADEKAEPEFTVDGVSEFIRLTEPVDAGIRITIIRKVGSVWYTRGENTASSGITLLNDNTAISRFIAQKTTDLPE